MLSNLNSLARGLALVLERHFGKYSHMLAQGRSVQHGPIALDKSFCFQPMHAVQRCARRQIDLLRQSLRAHTAILLQ